MRRTFLATQPTTTIRHIVVVPSNISEENCSFFQGFSRQVLEEYGSIFSALAIFPHDIAEIFMTRKEYAISKMAGSSLDIYLIKENLLDDKHIDFDREFNVIWSTKSTIKTAKKVLHKFDYEPVHVSTTNDTNCVYIDDISKLIISNTLKDLIHKVSKRHPKKEFKEFLEKLANIEPPNFENIPFPFQPLSHNCVAPTHKVLETYGYYTNEFEHIFPSSEITQHIKGIIELENLLDNVRKETELPSYIIKNDILIFCPSMYAPLYKANNRLWEELFRSLSKNGRNFIKKAIIRNKGYGNFSNEFAGGFNSLDKIVELLLYERKLELRLFTDIISIVAVNQFCAAIRLPNSVMLHHDQLSNIANIIKRPNQKSLRILNKKISEFNKTIQNDVGTDLINTSLLNREKLFAICDFPIEWISLNGFPIMFTHEISRICSTPGNLFAQMALSGQRMLLPYKAFTKILILRSFKNNDPIRNHLKIAIDCFEEKECYENLEIQFINISSEKEIIEALNAFNGFIVIFDCHGSHGGETGYSWLEIGNEKIDVWKIANKCRIPPIVILSACSTHPIDGSHASVANGFFRSGALSVIGTYAPVKATHAGQFVARLLFRLSFFVPLIIKQRPFTWREIVSGFLKMSYSTDVLTGLRDDLKLITLEQYMDIHNKANHIINLYEPNWTDEFLKLIESETSIDINQMKKIIQDNFQFVETMLYSQLGRPENITIYNDE